MSSALRHSQSHILRSCSVNSLTHETPTNVTTTKETLKMNARTAAYWTTTILIAFTFLCAGGRESDRSPRARMKAMRIAAPHVGPRSGSTSKDLPQDLGPAPARLAHKRRVLWISCASTSLVACARDVGGALRYDTSRSGAEVGRKAPRVAEIHRCEGRIDPQIRDRGPVAEGSGRRGQSPRG